MSDNRDVVATLRIVESPENAQTFRSAAQQAEQLRRQYQSAGRDVAASLGANVGRLGGNMAIALRASAAEQRQIFDEAIRVHDQFAATAHVNSLKVVNSLTNVGQGAVKTAKAVTVLGLAGQDDLERALRVFLRFSAAIDVFEGLHKSIKGVASAYQIMTTAAESARAARYALSIAEVSSGVVETLSGEAIPGAAAAIVARRGGGFGSQAAVGAVEGAAAAGASGLLGRAGAALASAGATLAGLALPIAGGFAAVVATLAWFNPAFREGLGEWLGLTDGEEEARKRTLDMLNRRNQVEADAREKAAILDRGRRESAALDLQYAEFQDQLGGGTGHRAALLSAQQRSARARMAAARSDLEAGVNPDEAVANLEAGRADITTALRESISLERERYSIAKRNTDEQLRGSQQVTSELHKQKRELEDQTREIQNQIDRYRDQYKSAAERFGELSAAEQSQAILAKQALDAGQTLTGDQRQLLKGLGLESVNESIGKQTEAAAMRAGFGSHFGQQEMSAIASLQSQQQGIRAQQTNIDVALAARHEIEVKLQADLGRIAEEVANKLFGMFEDLRKQLGEETSEALRRMNEQRATRRMVEEASSTG
ncbi:MAG: hypothetical protein K1X74_14210 [Pirellulales bacterium]|nr:hypothetical protein [Pirellulales bacterium]